MPAHSHAHELTRPVRSFAAHVWRARNWFHLPAIAVGLWLAQPTPTSTAIGLAIVAIGMIWRTWALGHIRKDETLCTTGPYSLTRHPLYLGNIVVLVGLLTIARSLPLAIGALAGVTVLYAFVIRAEEAALAELFGQQWQDYRRRVPLLLPALRRPEGKTDWRLALVNRAVLNWVLVGIVAALLASKPCLRSLLAGQ